MARPGEDAVKAARAAAKEARKAGRVARAAGKQARDAAQTARDRGTVVARGDVDQSRGRTVIYGDVYNGKPGQTVTNGRSRVTFD